MSVNSRAAIVLIVVMSSGSALCNEPIPPEEKTVESFAPTFDIGVLVRDEPVHLGLSGLMRAAAVGDLNEIDRLVSEGVDLDAKDINGRTALSNAAGVGLLAVVERLLHHGADPNIVARDGRTALAYAIRENNDAMINALLLGGSDPNYTIDSGGQSLLAYAAVTNQVSTVRLLLTSEANLEVEGAKALSNAIWKGNDEITAMLLESDIDVNAPTQNQQTVLHTAAERGSLNTVELLLEKGADVSATNRYGQTPLMVAITKDQSEIAERLVVEEKNATASHLEAAVLRGQSTVALALLEKMDLNSLPKQQVSDILIAAERNEDVRLLEKLLQITAAKTFGHGKPLFIFVRSTLDSCRVDRWDMASDEEDALYAESGPCQPTFHVEDSTRSLFVVGKTEVKAISLDDGSVIFEETFPMELVKQTARMLTMRWEDYWPGKGIAFDATLGIKAVGYTADGDLGFVANTTGPADGWYSYLFVQSNDGWRLTDERTCHRFEGSCPFAALSGRKIGDRDTRYAAWHPNVRLNPHYAEKHTLSDSEQSVDGPYWSGSVRFVFDGVEATIFHDAQEGEQCADDCIYARTIGLAIDDGEVELVSNYAFEHWIVGPYLLIQPTRTEPIRLIDLRSREVIFDNMHSGIWLF